MVPWALTCSRLPAASPNKTTSTKPSTSPAQHSSASSTAVFDLDSAALIRYAHAFLNAGLDFGGQPLGTHRDPRTHFTIGTGCEPEALDRQREWERLAHKIDAGADYVMTQPTFDRKALAPLTTYRAQVPIIVGVMVLRGLEHARRIAEVPGVVVPEAIFAELDAYADPADQAKAGVELAAEQVRQVRAEGWSGLYLMSPAGHQPVLGTRSTQARSRLNARCTNRPAACRGDRPVAPTILRLSASICVYLRIIL